MMSVGECPPSRGMTEHQIQSESDVVTRSKQTNKQNEPTRAKNSAEVFIQLIYFLMVYRVAHMYLNGFRMPLGELGVMVCQF